VRLRAQHLRGVGGPGADAFREPRVDLAELGPALERPARLQADPDQCPLGPHDVAVARRVPITLAVPDEHDGAAGGLVSEDAIALARPADEAGRVPVRVIDRGAPAVERRDRRDDRHVPHADRLERGPDEEPEPVRDHLDGDACGAGSLDEWHETGIVRLCRGGREEDGLGQVHHLDFQVHQAA